MSSQIALSRPPQTGDELWHLVAALWGVELPRVQVCPGHVSPFDAFAEAYFGNEFNWALWYGSRGTGKSYMLAMLGLTKAVTHEINVTLLGGSMAQSQNVHEHVETLLAYPGAPRHAIAQQIQTQIVFNGGNWIRPLPASQKTVRGPHPQMTLLDEIDEMERKIYDAAMGQAMTKPNARGVMVPEMVVASSTWQNPSGCMGVDTMVTTRRGSVPIQHVLVGDEVPTRHGWREVVGVHNTGMQETISVAFASGRRVTATPWHKFWTDSHGWVRADALTPGLHVGASLVGLPPAPTSLAPAHAASHPPAVEAPIVAAGDAVLAHVMPVLAGDGFFLVGEGTEVVLADTDRLEVPRVDAVAPPAQVVDVHPVFDGAVDLDPDPSVGRKDALREGAVGFDAVSVLHDAERPADAVVGVEVDGVAFAEDEVVDVSHVPIVLPTWDLTVDGTPEYVAGGILVHNTFQSVMDEANKKGMPVRTWCYKETLAPNGWMDPGFIERKRKSVPAEMFRVEYELGEPAGGSRAFDLGRLSDAFVDIDVHEESHSGGFDEWVFDPPRLDATYAAGADWAKEADKTVIAVVRTDVQPRRMVYLCRMNRRPWPEMIERFNRVTKDYAAVSAHDGTGIGNVVADLIDERTAKVVMVGRDRIRLLTDYITAVEQGRYALPRNTPAYDQHRSATVEDVYSPGTSYKAHLPDDVAAFAIMHRAAERQAPPAEGVGVARTEFDPAQYRDLNAKPQPSPATEQGVVSIVDTAPDVGVFWL